LKIASVDAATRRCRYMCVICSARCGTQMLVNVSGVTEHVARYVWQNTAVTSTTVLWNAGFANLCSVPDEHARMGAVVQTDGRTQCGCLKMLLVGEVL